ncbi:MAG: TraR/DksA C4-type zinc finger protein [Candidatus Paceibacterota bacterium]
MEINKFKGMLLDEKAKLEKELSDLGIMDPETGDWGAYQKEPGEADVSDKNDAADFDEDFMTRANTLGEIEKRYLDVTNALGKIERADGTFGKCEMSGEIIEEDRLEANPAARTCKDHMNG